MPRRVAVIVQIAAAPAWARRALAMLEADTNVDVVALIDVDPAADVGPVSDRNGLLVRLQRWLIGSAAYEGGALQQATVTSSVATRLRAVAKTAVSLSGGERARLEALQPGGIHQPDPL